MTARPMRILHTADWHLNDRLGRIDRQPDIVERLKEIAGLLAAHEVDVLLVAGDLFSSFSRAEALRTALDDLNRVFQPFLVDGGTIVVLSGNHDHEATFTMLRAALDLASPVDPAATAARPAGRLYLVGKATRLLLEGRSRQPVQFVLLPYPTQSRYLFDQATGYRSLEERNRALQQALVRRLDVIRRDHIRPELPSVLAAHIHVRGSELHSLYHLNELEDVVFEPSDLPTSWAYVALGHIHKPQALPGTTNVRYAGSIERFDFAEREDAKGVVLVDVGHLGLVGEPQILPLSPTPIYEVVITDPAIDVPRLAERYQDRERALVRYSLNWSPGVHDRDELCRQIESIFPRWYQRDVRTTDAKVQPFSGIFAGEPRDVNGAVRSYLGDTLKDHPDRSDLLGLSEWYLEELSSTASSRRDAS